MSPSTLINLLGYLNICLAATLVLPLMVNWITENRMPGLSSFRWPSRD